MPPAATPDDDGLRRITWRRGLAMDLEADP
jgi:hypothetical protein